MYNSLKYVKQLEEAGLGRELAETHVQIMTDVMETHFATKQDLKDLGVDIKVEITELRHEVRELESRMIIKLGTIVSLAVGVAVALAKII